MIWFDILFGYRFYVKREERKGLTPPPTAHSVAVIYALFLWHFLHLWILWIRNCRCFAVWKIAFPLNKSTKTTRISATWREQKNKRKLYSHIFFCSLYFIAMHGDAGLRRKNEAKMPVSTKNKKREYAWKPNIFHLMYFLFRLCSILLRSVNVRFYF